MGRAGRAKGARLRYGPAMSRPETLDEIKASLRALLPELHERYGVSYLAVFGSWVRGEQRPDSDVDVLVDFDRPIGWEIVSLEDEIGERLARKVDLVMRDGLKRRIGRVILQTAEPV